MEVVVGTVVDSGTSGMSPVKIVMSPLVFQFVGMVDGAVWSVSSGSTCRSLLHVLNLIRFLGCLV